MVGGGAGGDRVAATWQPSHPASTDAAAEEAARREAEERVV